MSLMMYHDYHDYNMHHIRSSWIMNLVHDVSCSNQSHLMMRQCDSALTLSVSIGAESFSQACVCSKFHVVLIFFVSFQHLLARKMFLFLTDRKEAVLNTCQSSQS